MGLYLAGAIALVWWHHRDFDNKAAMFLRQLVGAVALLGILFAIDWRFRRRVAWRVGPEGVAVYRGNQLRRSFGWAEIVSLQVHRAAVLVRLADPPFKERLQWPQKEGAAWLREYARQRLGDRMGGST
jgi:hypothetical protein